MLRSDVLPAPFGPITERISPSRTSRLTSSTAVTPPNCWATRSTRSCTWPAAKEVSLQKLVIHDANTMPAMQPMNAAENRFNALERRSPQARESALMAALPAQIAHAMRSAPGFARILAGVDAAGVNAREALARLPVTRKSDLGDLQKLLPPLGGLNATPIEKMAKLFVSPGPIYEPEGTGSDWWRSARALNAAGLRAGDLIINTLAYHFVPAGSMFESGAKSIGCTVVPAGTGQTEMQVSTIRDLAILSYVGPPSFLKLIVEKAGEVEGDISCLQKTPGGAGY